MKAPFLIGRALLGGFFLYNGINHFRQPEALGGYAKSKNVPAAKAGVLVSGSLLTFAGASLILGLKPKLGAAAGIGFLLGVSPLIHDFWNLEDKHQRQNDLANFAKNMALAGATLALAGVDEPWPASISRRKPSKLEQLRRFAKERIAA